MAIHFLTIGSRRFRRAPLALVTALGLVSATGISCDRMPLLAPSGSSLTLLGATSMAPAQSITITAVLVEGGLGAPTQGGGQPVSSGAGTPVHNGTLVTFNATLGAVSPTEARTVNGRVTVTFTNDGRTGQAVVTATSGPATRQLTITVQ
jgi:hypothetical protein